jgi:hypothetical protein
MVVNPGSMLVFNLSEVNNHQQLTMICSCGRLQIMTNGIFMSAVICALAQVNWLGNGDYE